MQGRAAAVYGLVFLLVAAGAFAYVSTAETPEPTMQSPEHSLAQDEEFPITSDDGEERIYRVGDFSEQRGQPAVTLIWTDEDARASEDWEYAEEPGQPSVVFEGSDYYVRPSGQEVPDTFLLQEAPPDDGNVSLALDEDSGTWLVNENGNYTRIEEYDGLNRIEVSTGDSFEEGAEDDIRTVDVEEVGNESVTVSWNEPAENEVLLRQTDREELNGVPVTVHFPDDQTVELTTDEDEIDRYIAAHEDREHFQQRTDGLIGTTVLALVALGLLIPLTQLPRKE